MGCKNLCSGTLQVHFCEGKFVSLHVPFAMGNACARYMRGTNHSKNYRKFTKARNLFSVAYLT